MLLDEAEEPYEAEMEVQGDGVLDGAERCRELEVKVGEEGDHGDTP